VESRKRQKSSDSLFDSEEVSEVEKEIVKPKPSLSVTKRSRTDSTISSASSTKTIQTAKLNTELSPKKRKLLDEESEVPCKKPKSSTPKLTTKSGPAKPVKTSLDTKFDPSKSIKKPTFNQTPVKLNSEPKPNQSSKTKIRPNRSPKMTRKKTRKKNS
jgi:hypothetical protein